MRAPQQGPGQRSKALGSAQLALQLPFQGLKESTPGKLAGLLALVIPSPPQAPKRISARVLDLGLLRQKLKLKHLAFWIARAVQRRREFY